MSWFSKRRMPVEYSTLQMRRRRRRRLTLLMALVFFVFAILLAAVAVAGSVFISLQLFGFLAPEGALGRWYIVFLLLVCLVLGTCLAAMLGRRPLRPFRSVIDATKEIAMGNFDVRVPETGPEELRNLAGSFNIMAQELSSIETLRNDFVSNVSHEFKTPVASISGFAKLLKKEGLSEAERQEYLDIIIKESERLSRLSKNVLLLSNLEAQKDFGPDTPYALDEQLRQAILVLQPEWQAKNLEFDIDLPEVGITANEELIQQIWLNVLGNAVKFSPDGGTVGVSLQERGNRIIVRISDQGPGIDGETRSRIFDKFYQGDTAHTTAGNGLGLSLVKRILEICGGFVSVESDPGEGATFQIELPKYLKK